MEPTSGTSTSPGWVICQVCGTQNPDEHEYCRRCQHKLLVLSGPYFDEEAHFEAPPPEEGFSFDEHLLERISVLEEVIKRAAETLGQLLGALRKQEKNILVNHTGLTALSDLLVEKELISRDELAEIWEVRMDAHLRAVDRRERFLALRDHIVGLYDGKKRPEFLRLLDEAERALTAYDMERAIYALTAAFQLDGDNYELAFFLGESYFDLGESQTALEYFQKVMAVRPDHYEGLVYTGAIHYELGDHETAEEHLLRSLEVYPEAFLPYFSLGAVHAGRGDFATAVEYLERAVAIDAVPQALLLLGKCLHRLGRTTPAIVRLEQATRIDPGFGEAYKLLGLAYLGRGWHRKALKALEHAEHLSPQKLEHRDLLAYLRGGEERALPEPNAEAREWFRHAEDALEEGSLKHAFVCYRRALEADSENPLLSLSYAVLCVELDRGREIEAALRRLLALDLGEAFHAAVCSTLIEALRGQSKYGEANALGRDLLSDAQTDVARAVADWELAYNLAAMGDDLDQALVYAREAAELAPEALGHLALGSLGWVHYRRREYPEAIDCLTRSSARAPAPTTLIHLAMALLAGGRREEAREVLEQARDLGDVGQALGEKLLECMRDSRRGFDGEPVHPKQ